MQKIRICFMMPDINREGAMTGMQEMVDAYRRQGANVEIITQDTRSYKKGIKTIVFGLVAAIRYLKLNKRFDIIHTQGANGWCNIFLRLAKPKKVITMHGCYAGELKATGHLTIKVQRIYWRFLSFLDKIACKNADAVFAISKTAKEELIDNNICAEEKIFVIHDGIDFKKFTGKRKKMQISLHNSILYAGRMAENKGLEELLKAFVHVKEKIPDAKLYLTGKPNRYMHKIKELIDKLNLKDVIFLGFVQLENLLYLYKKTSCFVLPSIYEPFGLVAGEAMANNALVILSNKCGIAEILDKRVAFILNDLKPEKIAETIVYVLKHQEKLKPMRIKAKKYIETNINIDNTARKMLSVEKALIGAKI
ncbi:MAG: glycosyltransferase family 4 protein [Candidatus Aenigmarchaeota archaeon]|nr:glycosyltransferase family 4 protein [Candidatus Aenigmarchaeota archaeon]